MAMADIHRAIGMGSDQMLGHLLPEDRDADVDEEVSTAHGALYGTYRARVRPLRGAADLLRACHGHGLRVVLASSADEQTFKGLRAALDAEDAIDAATFSAKVDRSKPEPDLVAVALDKAGVAADEAVFVGDTAWDVQACQKAGVRCVGFLCGGISCGELLEAGAAEIYDGPADLLARFPGRLLG